ncbi:MAG TPA: hypothetical protein VG347_14980 [Verrucomicrobiae bacterium]|nr:hypothetical protein [Verrucomicrobiae bacterium]
MNKLKLICLTIVQLPKSVFNAFKYRREHVPGAKAREAERLDRIRNPSKYLGK